LNQKLRKLVQQLGEAIHESVSESPQIAGVVADIEQQPVGAIDTGKAVREGASSDEKGAFTAQDLHFLKSLRISVSGERQGQEDAISSDNSDQEDA
jgi:hypothetical protein